MNGGNQTALRVPREKWWLSGRQPAPVAPSPVERCGVSFGLVDGVRCELEPGHEPGGDGHGGHVGVAPSGLRVRW